MYVYFNGDLEWESLVPVRHQTGALDGIAAALLMTNNVQNWTATQAHTHRRIGHRYRRLLFVLQKKYDTHRRRLEMASVVCLPRL